MGAGGQSAEAYTIDQSCRFNKSDDAYLYNTPGSSGNRRTWTFSTWVKKCSGQGALLGSGEDVAVNHDYFWIGWHGASNGLSVQCYRTPEDFHVQTSAVQRDPSAWYHIVVAFDTTQSVAANRVKIYINGSQETDLSATTYPTQNEEFQINHTEVQMVGSSYEGPSGGGYYLDGYLAETYLIDGTALTPSSFGETNSTTGQWVPIEVTGLTYGTNGFRFSYEDSSALGDDTSGEGNDYTSSGLAVADQMTDTPTDNFCTLNSIDKATQVTLADGNLQYGLTSNNYTGVRGTIGLTSGKWYWEVETVAGMGANTVYAGIATNASSLQDSNAPTDGSNYVFVSFSGNKAHTTNVSYGSAWNSNGKVIGVALDLDAGKIWWSIDDTWQASGDPAAGSNEAYSSITGEWLPYIIFNDTGPNILFNFGQSAFSGTQPSGFNAISTANFDDPTIADPSAYFQTTLYTGDGASSLAVNQGGNSTFSPDFVWIKNRDAADAYVLFDTVRGATIYVSSNNELAEVTDADTLTAFDSDGFTVGADVKVNTNTEKYVGWQWLADESFTSGATGTRIASSGIRNTTMGFSIASWTHTTSANYNIAHGLSTRPDFFLTRNRDGETNWDCWHQDQGQVASRIILNTSGAETTAYWSDPTDNTNISSGEYPVTSTLFGFQSGALYDGNEVISYFFTGIEGFSKFGSYTGNGSTDGPFIWFGFRPAYFLFKRTDSTDNWRVCDNQRGPYNPDDARLELNGSEAEASGDGEDIDFLSNGLKIRSSDTGWNASGGTYVFAAFADTPFKTALAR